MTDRMKFLLAGIFALLLLTAVALLMNGKTDSDSISSAPSESVETVADQPKQDPVTEAPRAVVKESRKSEVETNVSQAQIDLVAKREEARIRRDKMLEERAKTIKKLGPGNTGEPQQ